MAPEILTSSPLTCPSPGKLPRFLPRAWGNSRKISMEAQIIMDDDQIRDYDFSQPQRERWRGGDMRRFTGKF